MWPRPLMVNEPIKANQRTKFHFFSIIIDLESPEIITAVVWSRLRKNQRLVRKSSFLQICEYLINDLIDTNGLEAKLLIWWELSTDMHIVWICKTPRDYRAKNQISAN